MQNHEVPNKTCSDSVGELIRLKIQPSQIKAIMDGGEAVGEKLRSLEGFDGLDILLLSDVDMLVLIRWKGCRQFDRALPAIRVLSDMREWLALAEEAERQPMILKCLVPAPL